MGMAWIGLVSLLAIPVFRIRLGFRVGLWSQVGLWSRAGLGSPLGLGSQVGLASSLASLGVIRELTRVAAAARTFIFGYHRSAA